LSPKAPVGSSRQIIGLHESTLGGSLRHRLKMPRGHSRQTSHAQSAIIRSTKNLASLATRGFSSFSRSLRTKARRSCRICQEAAFTDIKTPIYLQALFLCSPVELNQSSFVACYILVLVKYCKPERSQQAPFPNPPVLRWILNGVGELTVDLGRSADQGNIFSAATFEPFASTETTCRTTMTFRYLTMRNIKHKSYVLTLVY
jgi:hypothetical protein